MKECGLPSGSYSSISDRVGANKLKQIFIKYPQISLDWVIMGTIKMFKNNNAAARKNDKNSERIDKLLDIASQQEAMNY